MTDEKGPGRGESGGVTGPEPMPGWDPAAQQPPRADHGDPAPGPGSDPTVPTGDRSEPSGSEPSGTTGEPSGAEPSGTTDEPSGSEPVDEPADETPRRGRVSYQDESTAPREPTLAEQRAHQQAQRQAIEDEQTRLADEEAARKKRKRLLIGGGAVAGVAALIAIGYAASGDDEEVEARCVGPDNVVVDDSNCVQPAASTSQASGGYYGGGGFFPIFIGNGNRQYHYNYGGTGAIGQPATGGTTTVPKDATVKSGTSGRTIQRGGFGVSSSSSGGGSSKGGSSGS